MTRTRTRVLFMIPTLTGGGAERVIVTLLRHLDRDRFAPTLVVIDGRNAAFRDEIPTDVEVLDIGSTRVRYALPKLARLIRRLRPDVVLSTLGQLNIALAILRPFLPGGVGYIARETIVVSSDSRTKRWPRLWASAHRLYRRFDKIICQSRDVQEDLIHHFSVPAEKTVLIHNPIDLERIRTLAAQPVADDDFASRNTLRLIGVGRLSNQKGFDMLIDAIAQCARPTHLIILGEGQLRKELEERAAAKGVADRVRFMGFLKNPYPFMAQADALVLSSRYEGFPNVVIEALACGTPVIATPAPGGVREILQGVTGCIVAHEITSESLAKAIERFSPETSIDSSVVDPYSVRNITKRYEEELKKAGRR